MSIGAILVKSLCVSVELPASQTGEISLCTTIQQHILEFLRHVFAVLHRLSKWVNSQVNSFKLPCFWRIELLTLLRLNASERSFLCSRSVIYFYLFIYIYFYVKKNILYKTSTLNWLKEARCTPWIYKDTNKPIFTELHFIVSLYRTLQKI